MKQGLTGVLTDAEENKVLEILASILGAVLPYGDDLTDRVLVEVFARLAEAIAHAQH